MIQLVAVRPVGTMPLVLEMETARLNPVQAQALASLPRSPKGVPELRALGKGDGEIRFRFKIPPEKLTTAHLPDLLSDWDAKFTEAKLKVLAKAHKAERDAATAAGLWISDSDKGDLIALHDRATPADAAKFKAALASVKEGSRKPSARGKRIAKPKELQAVVLATTERDPLTGEMRTKATASEEMLARLSADELVARMHASAGSTTAQLGDPLEIARIAEQGSATQQLAGTPQDAATTSDASGHPPVQGVASGEPPRPEATAARQPDAGQVTRRAIERHKAGKAGGPKLLELSPFDLFAEPDAASAANAAPAAAPGDGGAAVAQASASMADLDGSHCSADDGDPGYDPGNDPLAASDSAQQLPHGQEDLGMPERDPDADRPAAAVPEASPIEWTSLSTFRLSNQLSGARGRALVLPSGEVFEALGHLTLSEPLQVKVDWLIDAAQADDAEMAGHPAVMGEASRWMREQLAWRCKELHKWLGKTDLVTSPASDDAAVPRRGGANHAPGWVGAGTALAPLAQQIAMDIEMLDMSARDIERAALGMPTWAIEVMQQMRAFEELQAAKPVAEESAQPGAAFRDCWRAEVLRIDRWCAQFKGIKIARQFGLFGSGAEARLLVRLENLILRAKEWMRAPNHASRALAVWIAFVLSLDHGAAAVAAGNPSVRSKPTRYRARARAVAGQEVSHA